MKITKIKNFKLKLIITVCSLIFAVVIISVACIIPLNETKHVDDQDEDNSPLYLSPYIDSGKLEEGRRLAEVKPGRPFIGNVRSYSGLLTVDKQFDSNIFFWYFPAERKASEVPLLVYLNGFSTASTYGIFLQTGPYDLSTKTLKKRGESWQKYFHTVYLDSPVGVGYSFTNSSSGYSTDLDKVSLNLESALAQFLKLFPNLQGRELYLTGLSLAGKYIPSFAHRIYKNDCFNLKGIFVGNPLLDLERQLTYENFLYELGFIDKNQMPDLIREQDELKTLLKNNNYEKFSEEVYGFLLADNNYIVNITGLNNVYDYDDVAIGTKYYTEFITRDDVKKALHISTVPYDDGTRAMSVFSQGLSFSMVSYLEDMAESIKMMFYAGQRDVCIHYDGMVDVLMSMNWTGTENYKSVERQRLYEEDGAHVWGYLRNFGSLSDVLVRKAGHSAVTNQPKNVLWLLKNFTNYKRF